MVELLLGPKNSKPSVALIRDQSHFKKTKTLRFGLGGANRKVFFGKGSIFFFGPLALKPRGSKNWKKGENFRIRHPSFFFPQNFQPTNAAEKALFTQKQFFPKETVLKKK